MFSDEYEFQARVFLRSYEDSLLCLKQSAEKYTLRNNYENIANRLTLYVKQKHLFLTNQLAPEEQKDILAFQFTHFLFLKYMPEFDNFKGNYKKLEQELIETLGKMSQDLAKVSGKPAQ